MILTYQNGTEDILFTQALTEQEGINKTIMTFNHEENLKVECIRMWHNTLFIEGEVLENHAIQRANLYHIRIIHPDGGYYHAFTPAETPNEARSRIIKLFAKHKKLDIEILKTWEKCLCIK